MPKPKPKPKGKAKPKPKPKPKPQAKPKPKPKPKPMARIVPKPRPGLTRPTSIRAHKSGDTDVTFMGHDLDDTSIPSVVERSLAGVCWRLRKKRQTGTNRLDATFVVTGATLAVRDDWGTGQVDITVTNDDGQSDTKPTVPCDYDP
jgi:hypothetical protein